MPEESINPIEQLKEEHKDIERELVELETLEEEINIPNLVHTFKKLHKLWDDHENKEEKIFSVLKREEIIVPVKKMQLEHKKLRRHKDAIYKAVNSGSEAEIRKVLNNDIPIILKELRKHIADEDEVLYRTTLELLTPKDIKELEKII
jgi:hypothetical protein